MYLNLCIKSWQTNFTLLHKCTDKKSSVMYNVLNQHKKKTRAKVLEETINLLYLLEIAATLCTKQTKSETYNIQYCANFKTSMTESFTYY